MATWSIVVIEDATGTIAQMSANLTEGSRNSITVAVDGGMTINNDKVTLATMAGITKGSIIYGNNDGDPAYLAVGSLGEALISDGSGQIAWGTVSTVGDLSDLSDTDMTTDAPSNNDLLTFNGSDWVPETLSQAGVQEELTFGHSAGNALKTINGIANEEVLIGTTAGGVGVKSYTYSEFRAAASLDIGSDIQAYDAQLNTLSGLSSDAASAIAILTDSEIEVLDGTHEDNNVANKAIIRGASGTRLDGLTLIGASTPLTISGAGVVTAQNTTGIYANLNIGDGVAGEATTWKDADSDVTFTIDHDTGQMIAYGDGQFLQDLAVEGTITSSASNDATTDQSSFTLNADATDPANSNESYFGVDMGSGDTDDDPKVSWNFGNGSGAMKGMGWELCPDTETSNTTTLTMTQNAVILSAYPVTADPGGADIPQGEGCMAWNTTNDTLWICTDTVAGTP